MSNDFIANCVVCKKPIPRELLRYENGKEFHAACFAQHGSEVGQVDNDLHNEISKIREELAQLKNLKDRLESGKKKSRSKTKKRKSKKKTKKKRTLRKKKRKTARRKKTKKRTVRKKTKRRTAVKKRSKRSLQTSKTKKKGFKA